MRQAYPTLRDFIPFQASLSCNEQHLKKRIQFSQITFSLGTQSSLRHQAGSSDHHAPCWISRKGALAAKASSSHTDAISEPQCAVPDPTTRRQRQQAFWRAAKVLALCMGCFWLMQAAPAMAKAVAASHPSTKFSLGEAVKGLLSFILHLDKHLVEIIAEHGKTTYAILFAIVFCETGLVLTPFLPGDSLLFACGALAALGSLDFVVLLGIFISSAFLGDTVNYAVGNFLGTKAVQANLIKKDFITKTEKFYDKHGAKTVVLARFVPIVRTFAPFVAGIGSMDYTTFFLYNIGGAVLWSVLFTGAGLLFGNLPFVHKNFTAVVLGIVLVSVVPIVLEIVAARREERAEAAKLGNPGPPPPAGAA
eukprot:jgi/Botrbrau1/1679/Bobra.116_2s0023.1